MNEDLSGEAAMSKPCTPAVFEEKDGRRFTTVDETWAFGGVEIRSIVGDHKIATAPNYGMADMLIHALEFTARNDQQAIEVRL